MNKVSYCVKMFSLRLCFAAIVLPLSVNCFILDTFLGKAPQTVGALDLNKYLGRWYQMYASQSVVFLWESDAYCVTADYELWANGTVSVLNSERLHNATGPLKVITGSATSSNEPGKFTVRLQTVPVGASYWVLKLGPATYGDKFQYQYSIVSDNVRGTLFVLARDPDIYHMDYEAEVNTFLKEHGFRTFYNKPINTYHGKDCIYNSNHH
ncbi:apolipoprotein D-like [Mercenaria mercenaria]|uniref:apolipoprotein D-like n=1 Tax=Mercenaria mercenaria TaxID=6596 RepID=UPI00234F395F|nr:apolipoprotein D-like [Mercenaria mercenaria]